MGGWDTSEQVNKFEHVWGSRWDGPHLGVRFRLTSHGLNLTLHKAPFNPEANYCEDKLRSFLSKIGFKRIR